MGRYASFVTPPTIRHTNSQRAAINRHYSQRTDSEDTSVPYAPDGQPLIKGVDSLAGFTRFGRLLRSLRQLPSASGSPDPVDTNCFAFRCFIFYRINEVCSVTAQRVRPCRRR